PEAQRSTAAAATMFTNSLVSSGATAAAGILFTQFGYPRILLGLAASAAIIALLCRLLLTPGKTRATAVPKLHPSAFGHVD
ncbi:MAG TPA: hypothetical protein VHE33_03630, partial [Acidobacteriaceae bacterium]|nr:hypothetical protein [Acidobacteriaceae bacterium]